MAGLRLMLTHPAVARVSCELCKRLMFDPKEGTFHKNPVTGEAYQRPPGSPTPCMLCPKVSSLPRDKQNPTEGARADTSDRNRRALAAYFQARASRHRVTDPIALRNFGLIEELLDAHQRAQGENLFQLVSAMMITKR